MAEIIATQGIQEPSSIMVSMLAPLLYLLKHWYILAFAIIIIILSVVAFYLLFSKRDENKERDENLYFDYKKLISDCNINRNDKIYKKTYSWRNLFWFGIPLIWNDKSARIYNYHDVMIGRYRGHCKSQDGFFNIMICISSVMGLFDKNIILKVPESIRVVTKNKNTHKDEIKEQHFKVWRQLADGSFKIDCVGIERVGLYFHIPVIETIDNNNQLKTLDLRRFVEGAIHDSSYQTMASRILSTASKQVEKAMLINPDLKYRQMSPQKTAPEQELDND